MSATILQSHRPSEAAVLTKALFRVAERLGLTQRDLAGILATSESTISRLKSHSRQPSPAERQLAALLVRVYRSLDSLVGGDDRGARAWLGAYNTHLSGVPLELMGTIVGMARVAEYLDAMRGHL